MRLSLLISYSYKTMSIIVALLLTIASGPLIRAHPIFNDLSLNIIAMKVVGIAILALSQRFGIALHPFLAPPNVPLKRHLFPFMGYIVIALAVASVLIRMGYMPGYPALPTTSLLTAFMVPYVIFTMYLVLFTALIRNGYSRQWANLAFLCLLLLVEMHPWHPNPLMIAVSMYTYGVHGVYIAQLLAIALAVVTMKRFNVFITSVRNKLQ